MDAVSKREQTEAVYREHHETSRTPDFVYGGPERAELFHEWVGTGARVLDLGCRYGAMTRHYLAGNEIVGVDIDREALRQAAELGIEPLWADAGEPLPVPDESFDVVVVGELLEHLPFPDRTVAEARRVLRPGGRVVGSVPNGYRLKNRLRFMLGRGIEPDPTHIHLFSPAAIRKLLAEFENVELRYVAGRFTRLHPRLFANDMSFRGRKPLS
jgi:SAM-dependent methyltransferase